MTAKVEYQEHDRERAVREVTSYIRNTQAMSRGDRECAYALVTFFSIGADELLDEAVARARRGARR